MASPVVGEALSRRFLVDGQSARPSHHPRSSQLLSSTRSLRPQAGRQWAFQALVSDPSRLWYNSCSSSIVSSLSKGAPLCFILSRGSIVAEPLLIVTRILPTA